MTLSKQAIDMTSDQPMSYHVHVLEERVSQMVPRRARWVHRMGVVVTHLSLQDYCELHKLRLVEALKVRPAQEQERTELF